MREQVENFNLVLVLVLVLGKPFLYFVSVMDSQIVENQEDHALGISGQPYHEVDQYVSVHTAVEEPEVHHALVGHRRDEIDRFPLGIELDHRCLILWSISSSMLAVVSQTRFITPLNFGIFSLGSGVIGTALTAGGKYLPFDVI